MESIEERIKALNEWLSKFSIKLDDQVKQLGAGHIAEHIRAAIKLHGGNNIYVTPEIMHRLCVFNFITDNLGNKTLDGISINQSRYLEANTFLVYKS